jgi:hypothetical protein
MIRLSPLLVVGAGLLLPLAGRAADGPQLSAARLDQLDQRGYFTPKFKAAVHDLVDAQQAAAQAQEQEKKLALMLPGLRQQAADIQAQTAALHKELSLYEHPEDSDYDALETAMKDPAASPDDRLKLAQAFVWSYPTDPRQAEAEQDLRKIQKQIADMDKAARDADTAKAAARAKLLQRVQARDLSLTEWQDFLRDMSQEDLLTYLGRPDTVGVDYWIYSGAWTTDPVTKTKVGLQVEFNGTRVLTVTTPAPQ